MRGKILCGASAACLLIGTNAARATLLASDSFVTGTNTANSYIAGESLYNNGSSQGPTATGFSGQWNHGSGTNNFESEPTALTSPALGSTPAGDVYWPGATNTISGQRTIARNLTANVSSSVTTYYTSTLLEESLVDPVTYPPTAGNFAGIGYANTVVPVSGATTGTGTGFYVGFAQESAADPGSLVIRTRTGTAAANTDIVLIDGTSNPTIANTPYLVITETNINAVGGNQDRITTWINPTDLTSDATMTATASSTTTTLTYADQGDGNDLTRLEFAGIGPYATSVDFDETRLATTSADLYIAPVPEPASLGLAGIAAAGLLRRRRR